MLGLKNKRQAILNIDIRKRRNKILLSVLTCIGVFSFYSFKNFKQRNDITFSYNKDLKEKKIIFPEKTNTLIEVNKEKKIINNLIEENGNKIHKKDTKKLVLNKSINQIKKNPPPENNKINKISEVIAKQYNVTQQKAKIVVKQAYSLSKKHNVDPMTIIGIAAVESDFNEKAKNKSGAIGLMQALPNAHPDKIKILKKHGGSLYNIADNMELGTSIYSDYLKLHKGNKVKALQQYNGSLKDKNITYSKKVFKAIHQIQVAYNN